MNRRHPIARVAAIAAEAIVDLAAIGLFIAAALVWSGIIAGPL